MDACRLNLGCGTDIREGWINADYAGLPGVDILLDIGQAGLPFRDNVADEIVCDDVLEHIQRYDLVLRELHRIMKPGSRLTIRVPHFTSWVAYTDPTHVRHFAVRTFDFFIRGHKRSYYQDFTFSRMEKRRIVFVKDRYWWNRVLEHVFNINNRSQELYEETFLRIFPALNIEIVLVK